MEISFTKTYFRLIDGFWGGILSGIIMAFFGMLVAFISGKGFLQPLVLIGYTFQPYSQPPEMNAGVLFTGVLIHIAMSMISGVVFVLFANTMINQKKYLWIWSIVYMFLIWLFIQFGLLRMLNPIMERQINELVFLFSHIVFGISLGTYVARHTKYNPREANVI